MTNSVLFLLYYSFGFLPLLIFYFKYRKMQLTKSCYNLLPYVFVVFIATCFEFFILRDHKEYSLYWIRFYDLIEYYSILYFFYKELNLKKVYLFFGVTYFILYGYSSLSWNSNTVGDLLIVIYTVLMVLISSVLWFINAFRKFKEPPLYKRSSFYFISALLFYFSGTVIVFISMDYVWKKSFENLIIITFINLSINCINRVVISIALFSALNKK